MVMHEATPEGWHVDPMGRYAQRWWDGTQWSSHVSDAAGSNEVDPLGISGGTRESARAVSPVLADDRMSAPAVQPHASVPGQWSVVPPQTPGYGLPGGGAWAAPQQIAVANVSKSPGLAVASLVLGVGAFFFSLIPLVGFISIPFAICGVALGISGVLRAKKGYEGRGLSIAGILASAAALLISFVYVFAIGDAVNDLDDGINTDPVDGFCNVDRYLADPDC
jgi:hypothetical protein